MKTTIIYFAILISALTNCSAQRIIRSSFSCFGNGIMENGTLFRQTIGQASSTTVFSNDGTSMIQGFQQPVLNIISNSSQEKECTLYLNPNPTSDLVQIKFAEEIGENQISLFDIRGALQLKVNTNDLLYEMDVSKIPKGIYIVNVISESGYQCNQKLVIL